MTSVPVLETTVALDRGTDAKTVQSMFFLSVTPVALLISLAEAAFPRALAIPEVLSKIMTYVNKRDQAICARVSKYWSEIALDRLWDTLASIVPLLELLCPLVDYTTDEDGYSIWVRASLATS